MNRAYNIIEDSNQGLGIVKCILFYLQKVLYINSKYISVFFFKYNPVGIVAFYVVTPCSLVVDYQYFG
jgi:hypothetical protein